MTGRFITNKDGRVDNVILDAQSDKNAPHEAVRRILQDYDNCGEITQHTLDYARAAVAGLDWEEDFSHENGRYQNKCVFCGNLFLGHKRRVVCKRCEASADPRVASVVSPIAATGAASLQEYPNLAAIYMGTIAGEFRDWVRVRGELRHYVDSTRPSATLAPEKAYDQGYTQGRNDECGGVEYSDSAYEKIRSSNILRSDEGTKA